jgi:hypothetical protein
VTEPIGEVRVEVRGDTSKVDPDIERGLKAAAKDADHDLKNIGHDWGNTLGDALGDELGNHGPDFARSIKGAFAKEKVSVPIHPEADTDRNVIRQWTEEVGNALRREVVSSGGNSNGPFGRVGAAISDAIGAGFNISGKSPLIAFLVPLVGFIGELIVGAIQAANALVAVLLTIPSLIGAIILQAGVLFLAFHGLGDAITNAFAAKNPQELQKAIQGLVPEAQNFVKSLLPIKDIFEALSRVAQTGFFGAFGNSIEVAQKAFAKWAPSSVQAISEALGDLGRTVVTFFADPVFLRFIETLVPATVKWIQTFGPALNDFLVGLANLGTAIQPFLDWVGQGLNDALSTFGKYLTNLSNDKDFLAWLEDMKSTLSAFGDVLKSALGLIVSLTEAVDKAGGKEALKEIAAQLTVLAGVLSSEVGTKGLEGIINSLEFLSATLVGLVIVVLFLSASLQAFFTWLIDKAFPAIGNFFSNTLPEFFTTVGHAIMEFFTSVGEVVSDVVKAIGGFFGDVGAFILTKLFEITGWVAVHVANWIQAVIDFFKGIPTKVKDAVGNLIDTLYEAGKNLIQGLINGALSKLGPLGTAMSQVAGTIAKYIPHSPAEEGPLSGKGDPLIAGQTIVDRLAAGIEMESPQLSAAMGSATSNIVFGPNSVNANFYGALPTQQQALATGSAVGQGVSQVLAARDTRLAVRTM